jgi:AraC-like DNA-binding protein
MFARLTPLRRGSTVTRSDVQGATVATTSSRALLAACRQLGLDTDALLADAGLTREEVENPDARLPAAAVATLFRRALVVSGDAELPLRAAEAVPFGAYKIIDFLAASAPTVGDGLAHVARYFPLINSAVELRIREHDDGAMGVELRTPLDPAGVPRPYAEYALAVTFLHCRHAAGFAWPLQEVRFAFPRPDVATAHERLFGCAVSFDARANELVIAREVWDAPSHGAASSALLRVLEEHADRTLASLRSSGTLESRVTELLVKALRGGDPSLEAIAKALHLSPRTLQRRLQAEGSSFADVLDRTRRSTADVYLKERGLALTEIAYLLGFSEQSAFSRAFQRWYGVAPSRYRAAQTHPIKSVL